MGMTIEHELRMFNDNFSIVQHFATTKAIFCCYLMNALIVVNDSRVTWFSKNGHPLFNTSEVSKYRVLFSVAPGIRIR